MEIIEDGATRVVRNVETDVVCGYVNRPCIEDPHDPDRLIFLGCVVLNTDLEEIATIPAATVQRPLEHASVAVANYEAYYGYPGFKHDVEGRPEPDRVEHHLGTLMAHTASVFAHAILEYPNGGLRAETKSKLGDLMVQLFYICFASSFYSFNAERRVLEPYFANPNPSQPRLLFDDAAKHWGMEKLRSRLPDASDALLQEALSWPLSALDCMINRLVPLDRPLSQCKGFKVGSPSGRPH
jgi:hypothetical protein